MECPALRGYPETELRRRVGPISQGTELEEQLLSLFIDSCEENAERAEPPRRLEARIGRWIIRDEDLELFATVREAILALASANFVFADLTITGIMALAFTLVQLLRNAYRSGAIITARQAQVLVAMKKAGRPLSAEELLSKVSAPGKIDWDIKGLQRELEALSAVATRSGIVKLLESNKNGEWCLSGV